MSEIRLTEHGSKRKRTSFIFTYIIAPASHVFTIKIIQIGVGGRKTQFIGTTENTGFNEHSDKEKKTETSDVIHSTE